MQHETDIDKIDRDLAISLCFSRMALRVSYVYMVVLGATLLYFMF